MRNFDTTGGKAYWRAGPILIDPKEDGSVRVEYTEREAVIINNEIRYLANEPRKSFFTMTPTEIATASAPIVDPSTDNHTGSSATALELYSSLLAFIRQRQELN